MDSLEKQALQVAKEIVVKFIEVGRISPANFAEHFSEIYGEVLGTVSSGGANRLATATGAVAGKKGD
ncbi:MAG: hypothetical protein AB7E46_14015 [Desulfovibrio sp.]|jgi:hypothetical protein